MPVLSVYNSAPTIIPVVDSIFISFALCIVNSHKLTMHLIQCTSSPFECISLRESVSCLLPIRISLYVIRICVVALLLNIFCSLMKLMPKMQIGTNCVEQILSFH